VDETIFRPDPGIAQTGPSPPRRGLRHVLQRRQLTFHLAAWAKVRPWSAKKRKAAQKNRRTLAVKGVTIKGGAA